LTRSGGRVDYAPPGGVPDRGYYASQGRALSAHARRDQELAERVSAVHLGSRRRYGSPRVHAELQATGERGRKRVARLMRENDSAARTRRRFRKTTDSKHSFPIAPNVLERDFTAAGPDEAWVTDITFLWTTQGWLYLAVILDLFSRRVVGWATSRNVDRHLALAALDMALNHRRPTAGLVHHSDSRQHLRQRRLPQGTGGPGNRMQHEPPGRLLG
jgi:putative transposase